MRSLIGLIGAIIGGVVSLAFLAGPLANRITINRTFDDPVNVDNFFQYTIIGIALAGAVVGWIIGLIVGKRFARHKSVE